MQGWRVGDKWFQNKLRALEEGQATGKEVEFHFFEEGFLQADWKADPGFSYQELLKQRALEIRNSYDYIRLFYSGGVDSQTILNTFLKNNIPIDEIDIYRYSPNGNTKHPVCREVNEVAIPFIEANKEALKKCKIQILDLTFDRYKNWFKGDWLSKRAFLDHLAPDPPDMIQIFPELTETYGHQKLCFIQGGQKPKIRIVDGRFQAFFYDSHLMADLFAPQILNFYTDAGFPLLHIKQCHLAMKLVKEKLKTANEQQKKRFPNEWINEACRDPLYRPIDLGKSDLLLSSKSQLIWTEVTQEKIFAEYIDFLEQNHCGDWFNNGNIKYNFKGIETQHHFFLED